MNLRETIASIIEREGGYVNHPLDRGGETNWGITVNTARAFGYKGMMIDMPRTTAEMIYEQRYWIQPNFGKIAILSPLIAEEMLDTGVNMGPSTAGKFLQRALNVLDQPGKFYPALTVDGAVGAMTIHALKMYLAARGKDGEKVMLRMLNGQQSVRYMELAEASPSQEAFEFGWQLNRVGGF